MYTGFYQLPPLPSYVDRGYSSSQPAASTQGHSSSSQVQVSDKGRPTFGVDLAEQMARDTVEIPAIMDKCCAAIEKYGITSQGIYRISGTMNKVQKLKERLDRGKSAWPTMLTLIEYSLFPDFDSVNLDAEEWSADINNVSSVLKLWLRELPDPLLTFTLHQGFIDAASMYRLFTIYLLLVDVP